MEPNQLTQGVSAESWVMLAKLARISPEEFKSRYEALLTHGPEQTSPTVAVREAVSSDNCVSRDFDVNLFKVAGVSGTIKFCGSSLNDWTASVHISLDVAGSSVWHTDYTLSPQNASICYNPSFAVVKAQLCIGIVGANHCFNIHGNVGHWAFGWHYNDFNETLFCFN